VQKDKLIQTLLSKAKGEMDVTRLLIVCLENSLLYHDIISRGFSNQSHRCPPEKLLAFNDLTICHLSLYGESLCLPKTFAGKKHPIAG